MYTIYIYFKMSFIPVLAKLNQSHEPSEIILICWKAWYIFLRIFWWI